MDLSSRQSAAIGGAAAGAGKGSILVIIIVTIGFTIAGGLIGFGVKRRVNRFPRAVSALDEPDSK